jgi:UDP-N-acetylmuramoyl-tripeptide--D-alanyl-D-alanine ligase
MTTEQIYLLYLQYPKVETDSRKIEKGCLFFALKGEKFNGNQFAAEALEKGAAYAIIDEKDFYIDERTVLVDDVLETLQSVAHMHRQEVGIPVLGITGSNGKTTTKELIASVLSKKYKIAYTKGNLNNHIGVPLTLLQMDWDTDLAIVEMGANHAGEIGELCAIADPDFGIITNIGIAHLEGFGSYETIKKTKSELYWHVNNKKGIVFYNSDNPVLAELAGKVQRRVSYGKDNADYTGKYISSTPFIHAQLCYPENNLDIHTNLIGDYNFENLLAAACIGRSFNVNPQDIQSALASYQPQNNRSQMIEKNGIKIVMDAYNANPTSMKASINSFLLQFPVFPFPYSRRYA